MTKPKTLQDAIDWPQAGLYIVAVSGGVDSIVLLDLLASAADKRGYQLIVTYFDHGWRDDTSLDIAAVKGLAHQHGLQVEVGRATTKSSSEAEARHQRYQFLEDQRQHQGAAAIITAHHADDWLETAVFNTLRGSGPDGLVMAQTDKLKRPLLALRKQELISYAQEHRLVWHPDTTNTDSDYTRNYLRHEVLPTWLHLDPGFVDQSLALLTQLAHTQAKVKLEVQAWLKSNAERSRSGWEIQRTAINNEKLVVLEVIFLSVIRDIEPSIQISAGLVAEVARFAKAGHTGQCLSLPGNLMFAIKHSKIIIGRIKQK